MMSTPKIRIPQEPGRVLMLAVAWVIAANIFVVPGAWAEDSGPPAPIGHWAEPERTLMVKMGIASAGWRLDENCNRSRYASMLAALIGVEDVSGLVTAGVLRGFPDGQHHLERPVTRAEAAVMLSRALTYLQASGVAGPVRQAGDSGGDPRAPGPVFTDIAGHWAAGAIVQGTEMGIFKGYGDGTWKPGRELSTGEAVAILARFAYATPPPAVNTAVEGVVASVSGYYEALAAGLSHNPVDVAAAAAYTTGAAHQSLLNNAGAAAGLTAGNTSIHIHIQELQTTIVTRSALVAVVQVDRQTVEIVDGKATPNDISEVLYLRLTPSGWKIFH